MKKMFFVEKRCKIAPPESGNAQHRQNSAVSVFKACAGDERYLGAVLYRRLHIIVPFARAVYEAQLEEENGERRLIGFQAGFREST